MISALLAALVGGEIVASVLAAIGITGRAATAISLGSKALPHVLKLFQIVQSKELTPEELETVQRARTQMRLDLGGPMDFP
jgi:hypothetical protein